MTKIAALIAAGTLAVGLGACGGAGSPVNGQLTPDLATVAQVDAELAPPHVCGRSTVKKVLSTLDGLTVVCKDGRRVDVSPNR